MTCKESSIGSKTVGLKIFDLQEKLRHQSRKTWRNLENDRIEFTLEIPVSAHFLKETLEINKIKRNSIRKYSPN